MPFSLLEQGSKGEKMTKRIYSTGWHHSEETKRKIGLKSKGRIPSEETRKKLSKAGIGRVFSIETRKKLSEGRKGIIFSEEHCKHISESHKEKPNRYWLGKKRDPETGIKIGNANRGRKNSEESKRKVQLSLLGKRIGPANPAYIDGRSREDYPYCPKFNNEFKERVIEFPDHSRRCMYCGKPETKNKTKSGKIQRLTVHHILFDKKTCCNDSPTLFAALCFTCRGKADHDRDCTGINKELIQIIMEKYDGKCYFTKEEWTSYKKGGNDYESI
jgi:hypothetical protein